MTTIQLNEGILKHSASLKAYAISLTKNSDDANDLIQDTNYKAFKNKDKFRLGTNLKAWLFTIMRNEFINKYRQKSRRKVLFDSSDNTYLINSSSEQKANEGISNVLIDEINSLVENLKDEYKIPFKLNFEGYRYNEIAEKLNVPLGTVKSRIFFARRDLKKAIKEHYGATKISDFSLN